MAHLDLKSSAIENKYKPSMRKSQIPIPLRYQITPIKKEKIKKSKTIKQVANLSAKDKKVVKKDLKIHPETPTNNLPPRFELKVPTLPGIKMLYKKDVASSQNLKDLLKDLWVKHGNRHLIAAKHTEFVVEPKVFIGDKLNPQILEALVINYLANTSAQDSGTGKIEVKPDKLIIKSPKGRPLVIVRDKKIIGQYLSQQD